MKIGERLNSISVENPYPAYLIGLVESAVPHEQAHAIASQFAEHHLHDGWFQPAASLLQLIQQGAQHALSELLAVTRPGAVGTQTVDIDEIARHLRVWPRTVR